MDYITPFSLSQKLLLQDGRRYALALLFLAIGFVLSGCQTSNAVAANPTIANTATPLPIWTAIPEVVAQNPTFPPTVLATVPNLGQTERASAQPTSTPTMTLTATAIPSTATPTTRPPTLTNTVTPSRAYTLIPTNTLRPTISLTPSRATTRISTLIPGVFGGDSQTWTPFPTATSRNPEHYLFQRPFSDAYNTYWARNYAYGSTDNRLRPVHHGIDIQNESGTPVLAAGEGIVYYADADTLNVFGSQPDFYGNVVVIEHPFQDANGRKVYTLYGHLSAITVQRGEKVKTGTMIGQVGSTGVALGAHLHFEVRLGKPEDYYSTLNPELWVIPYYDYGVIAGRVMDINGKLLEGVQIQVQSAVVARFGYSYTGKTVNSDPLLGENFAIPDLPAGYYTVMVRTENALLFRDVIYVEAGRTNWITIHLAS